MATKTVFSNIKIYIKDKTVAKYHVHMCILERNNFALVWFYIIYKIKNIQLA